MFFNNVSSTAIKDGQGDDGSCDQTLGAGCVNDLSQALTSGEEEGCGGLGFESLPASCEGRISIMESQDWNVAGLYSFFLLEDKRYSANKLQIFRTIIRVIILC